MPISIPPPALEVVRPSGERPRVTRADAEALIATRVMAVVAIPDDALPPPTAEPPSAAEPEPEPEPAPAVPSMLRTRVARKLTTLAEQFNDCFSDFRIGVGAWRVELSAPEGMSTRGGRDAVQTLRLQPTAAGHPTLVIGTVRSLERVAELRVHSVMEANHRQRFDAPAPVTASEWAEILDKCELVLRLSNVAAAYAPLPASIVVASPLPRRGRRLGTVMGVVAIALVAALWVWRLIASF